MGYDAVQNSNIGWFAADVDMSNPAVYRYAWVWFGPALNIVGHGQGGGAVQPQGSLTTPPLGIAQGVANQGEAIEVCRDGVSKSIAGGTIPIGSLVMPNAAGASVVATSGNLATGRALESAVTGDIFTVEVKSFGKQ